MAARGPHIQELVILAATLCCNNLTISWSGKLTLNVCIVLWNKNTNTRTNEYKETLLVKGIDRQNFEISLRSAIFYRKSMTHHKICYYKPCKRWFLSRSVPEFNFAFFTFILSSFLFGFVKILANVGYLSIPFSLNKFLFDVWKVLHNSLPVGI